MAILPSPSPSTPTRCLNLKRHSDDPLEREKKRCSLDSKQTKKVSLEPMTTSELGIAFEQCNFLTAQDLSCIAKQICVLKRQLRFSSVVFVKTLLNNIEPEKPYLSAYHQLSGMAMSVISLDSLVEHAPQAWLVDQCRKLLPEDPVAYRDYVASLLAIELKSTSMTWNPDSTIARILHSSLQSFANPNEPLRDGVYLEYFFQLLQDPHKLKMFSQRERQKFVTSLLDHVLWHQDTDNCSVGSILSAKELVCADGSNYFATRRSIFIYLVDWLKDEKQAIPAFYCPLLPCCALDKVHWATMNVSNSATILGLCRAMCEALERDQEVVRIAESVSAYTKLVSEELSNQPDLGRLALLLSFVQITLHYKGDSVGLNYASWFQSVFVDPNTTCLKSKKNGQALINCLQDMIAFELPAILQVHSKALSGCQLVPSSHYTAIVKTRLLDLGLDPSLRQLPVSINTPLVADKKRSSIRGHSTLDIQALVQDYVNTTTVPKSLWEASIFQARWFKATFLPAFVSWNHTDQQLSMAHKRLIKLLYEKGKIPNVLYREFQNMI